MSTTTMRTSGLSDVHRDCLHELFIERARRQPTAVALTFSGIGVTYRQLDQRTNQLARYLRRYGIGPDVVAGIFLDRSIEMIVAIIAILKAGGAYLPLEVEHPAERVAFMLRDSGAKLIVTNSLLSGKLPEHACQSIALDQEELSIGKEYVTAPRVGVTNRNLAYVIYTSGSTGTPKGVMIEHRAIMRLFDTASLLFQFDETDVWMLFHGYGFDVSVWEMWGCLLTGGRLVIIPSWVARMPRLLYEVIIAENVTILNQTPSAFPRLSSVHNARRRTLPIRYTIFAGESLKVGGLTNWLSSNEQYSGHVVNMYGTTETTVHATYHKLSSASILRPAEDIVGVPLADLCIHVLDQDMQPVPIGVIGELYISGAGLARGYLSRPGLTAERFVANPFREGGQRMYRTGDLGRLRDNGELEYFGRKDLQVKIRGYRVELGEIEAALLTISGLTQAVVGVDDSEKYGRQLVAYVPRSDQLSEDSVRDHLRKVLPEYMIPTVFVSVDSFPITLSGKVDRRALRALHQIG